MSLPSTFDSTLPGDVDSPSQGAAILRTLRTNLQDILFGSAQPFTLSGAPTLIDADGQQPAHVRLTNQTGGTHAIGDVVALSTATDKAVVLSDVWT